MDEHPFKYLAMEKACDRKTDMTCLCTTCSRGGAALVLGMCPFVMCVCVCVCVCVFCSGCVGRWCYCGGHSFRLRAFLLESHSYYLIDQPGGILVRKQIKMHIKTWGQSKLGVKSDSPKHNGLMCSSGIFMHDVQVNGSWDKVLDLLNPPVTLLTQSSETVH